MAQCREALIRCGLVYCVPRKLLVLDAKASPKAGTPHLTLSCKPLLLKCQQVAPRCLVASLDSVRTCGSGGLDLFA